jgi:hypothetical protein
MSHLVDCLLDHALMACWRLLRVVDLGWVNDSLGSRRVRVVGRLDTPIRASETHLGHWNLFLAWYLQPNIILQILSSFHAVNTLYLDVGSARTPTQVSTVYIQHTTVRYLLQGPGSMLVLSCHGRWLL